VQASLRSMTDLEPDIPPKVSGWAVWKVGLASAARVLVSVTLLFVAYYQIPTKDAGDDSDLPYLILSMTVFVVVVAIQVPAIVKSKHPILRAVESLAVTVALFLLIFARIYLSNSLTNPGAFTIPLDHTTSLYFTVTVFATVGFGDITAQTNPMRLLVTVQMLLNLAVLGLVIRVITSAARRGVKRKAQSDDGPEG